MARRDLRGLRPEAGDGLLRDRDSLVVIPAALVDEVAEAAAEAVAFEEFTADQVAQGGGVYGLHIPSGERAKQAFAQWRRMKGKYIPPLATASGVPLWSRASDHAAHDRAHVTCPTLRSGRKAMAVQ